MLIEPTSPEETLQILRNIKDKYEEHHNVVYTEEALEACVRLTDRYVTDRYFPDKAIDAMDEAGSRIHLTHISVPKEIEEQENYLPIRGNIRMKPSAYRILSWPPVSATGKNNTVSNWNA